MSIINKHKNTTTWPLHNAHLNRSMEHHPRRETRTRNAKKAQKKKEREGERERGESETRALANSPHHGPSVARAKRVLLFG
jgi:hypothetical protein